MASTSTDLIVLDRVTGEVLNVKAAETEQLAEFMTNLADLRGELADAETLVSDEIVSRLDKNASWTLRVGDPKVHQWEIKSTSSADVEIYPPGPLEQKLLVLIADDVISETAAEAALKRTLTVEFVVPFDTAKALEHLARALENAAAITIDEVDVRVTKVTAGRRAVAAGIAKLRKVPGAVAALDQVKDTQPAGHRRATVKMKARES